MNKKKIGAIILFSLCMLFIYINQNMLFRPPFSKQEFENIVYVTKDGQENMFVLDSSGRRLRKISPDNDLQWEVQSSAKDFEEAKRVVVNKAGSIFIQEQSKEEGSFHISSERILEYSPDGELKGIVAEYNYEEAILSPRIGGLFPTDRGLVYIYKWDDKFELYDQDQKLIKAGALDLASYIPSFAWDNETKEVYYSTYSGQVCLYVDGNEDIVLYDAADSAELSIPREISLDSEQNLYVADIGLRDVLKINTDKETERITEDIDLYDKEISYYLNADHGLIVCTDYSVKQYQDGEYNYLVSCNMTKMQNLICILLWACVIILGIMILGIAIWFIYYMINSATRLFKMAAGMILGVTVVAMLFAGILIPQFQKLILDTIISKAQMTSDIMIENLPYEEFKRIETAADFMGEDYLAVREAAAKVFMPKYGENNELYCAFYKILDGMIVATYCSQENTGAIHPQDWPYEGSDEQNIIETRQGKVYTEYQTSEGNFLFVLNPVIDDTGEVIGLLEVGADLNSFQRENQKLILDMVITILAIMVVVILISIEFMIFASARSDYHNKIWSNFDNSSIPIPTGILRIIVFAIFFLTNIATSFLPNYAMRLAQEGGINSLPSEVMAALPISAEVIVGALFSIFGNKMMQVLGEKRSVILSAILFTVGFGLRIIPNIWILTLGNAVIGAGWGLLLLIINTIIAMKPEREKDEGFASYNAAALNGVNCGVVFGGFLINWLSYQWILILATMISTVVYFIVKRYLTSYAAGQAPEEESSTGSQMSVFRFLLKGRILSYFIMIVVPIIACGYFTTYMFPILASGYGLQETYIGYSYLLNGLCVMCFSNVLTNFFSKKNKKVFALVFASVLYCAAFVIVAWYQSLPALLLTIILMGLSDSFGLPLQTGYYTDLDEVKEFGYDRAIGIYSLFENGAQSAGSFIFSYVLLIGVRQGLYLVVGIILVLALLFLVIGSIQGRRRNFRSTMKNENY